MVRHGLHRSSQRKCSFKKGVLKIFAKFTGKHLCQSLFFNWNFRWTLLKMRLWHRCLPVNFAKFSRTLFFKEHLRWLLLVERSINKSQEKERIKRSLCINYWLRKQNSLSITLIILFRLIIVKLDNFFFLSPKTFFSVF